jgi:hypothetical protein
MVVHGLPHLGQSQQLLLSLHVVALTVSHIALCVQFGAVQLPLHSQFSVVQRVGLGRIGGGLMPDQDGLPRSDSDRGSSSQGREPLSGRTDVQRLVRVPRSEKGGPDFLCSAIGGAAFGMIATTLSGKHGAPDDHTEVPREALVTELMAHSDLRNTEADREGQLWTDRPAWVDVEIPL